MAVCAFIFVSAQVADAQYIYPKAGQDWQKAKPQKYDFSPEALEKVTNFVIDSTHATGIIVIVGGEQIYSFGVLNRLSYLASCRKSLLSMLYGKYVENGTIDLTKTMSYLYKKCRHEYDTMKAATEGMAYKPLDYFIKKASSFFCGSFFIIV